MIDLHCHTTASDGVLAPCDLVKKGAAEGLDIIAVADHDTADGIDDALRQGAVSGIRVIPCIELSVEYKKGEFHLLGYGVRRSDPAFGKELSVLREIRENRIPVIIDRLNAAGIGITRDDVLAFSRGAVPGKPHVARALVHKGYAPDFDDAFRRYLASGAPGDVPKKKITPEKAFSLIRSAGGVPVVAHPVSLALRSIDEFDSFLNRYVPCGLAGVEAYASLHSDSDVELYAAAARRFSLCVTGGSDFHGDKDEALGFYGKNRMIP
ncbi:MAG: PHP domain-containing protein, partial [Spirochaetota bacterium]